MALQQNFQRPDIEVNAHTDIIRSDNKDNKSIHGFLRCHIKMIKCLSGLTNNVSACDDLIHAKSLHIWLVLHHRYTHSDAMSDV